LIQLGMGEAERNALLAQGDFGLVAQGARAQTTGSINSGGNVGNAISVGNTTCFPVEEKAAAPEAKAPKEEAPAAGAAVVALPDTGVGIGDASALFALITSAGAAAASLALRRR
jgi:hypothetical protein